MRAFGTQSYDPSVRWRVGLYFVAALGLILRLGFLSVSIVEHYEYFFPDKGTLLSGFWQDQKPHLFEFGWEASSIACAWVCVGDGFANPFGARTGPTAWIAPAPVLAFALAFSLFGCFTPGAVLFLFALSLLFSLFMTGLVFLTVLRLLGDPLRALGAAFLFAVLPFDAWIFRVTGHLDFNFPSFALAVTLFAAVAYWQLPQRRTAMVLGAVGGAAAHVFPGFALCAVVAVGAALGCRIPGARGAHLLAALGSAALVAAPYSLWQSIRLGMLVPVKSNAGFELFLGNQPEAGGVLAGQVFARYHPSQNVEEFGRYRRVGEARYVREKGREFWRHLSFEDFCKNTLRRLAYFFFLYDQKPWDHGGWRLWAKRLLWFSPGALMVAAAAVAWRRRQTELWLVLSVALAYAAPYLVAGIMDRYKYPLAPLLCVLAVALPGGRWPLRARPERHARGKGKGFSG